MGLPATACAPSDSMSRIAAPSRSTYLIGITALPHPNILDTLPGSQRWVAGRFARPSRCEHRDTVGLGPPDQPRSALWRPLLLTQLAVLGHRRCLGDTESLHELVGQHRGRLDQPGPASARSSSSATASLSAHSHVWVLRRAGRTLPGGLEERVDPEGQAGGAGPAGPGRSGGGAGQRQERSGPGRCWWRRCGHERAMPAGAGPT